MIEDQNSNSTGRRNPINRILGNTNQHGAQVVNHEDSSRHSEAQSDGNPNVIIINDVENDANNNSYNNLSEIVDYMVGDIGNDNSSNTDINSHVANNNANNNSFENIANFVGIDDNRSNITLESADGRDCCKNCGCPIF